MTVFKTFFWTSVIWALALVGLWFGADYEERIAQTWAQVFPQAAQQFLMIENNDQPVVCEMPEQTPSEEAQATQEEPKADSESSSPSEEVILPSQQEPTLPETAEELTQVLQNPETPAVQTTNALNAEVMMLQEQLHIYKWRAELLESYVRILLNEKAEKNGIR